MRVPPQSNPINGASVARQLFDVNLASVINVNSSIAVGGKLYFLESDGVTLATTYTTPDGMVPNTNPMLAQNDGRFAQQAWLEAGDYVYVLTSPLGDLSSPLFTGQFSSFVGTLENDLAGKVDIDLGNGDFSYPGDTAALAVPYYNFRTQTRNLADFIDKDQWANCRAGTPSVNTTNGRGQDSLTAAIADMESAVGGTVIVPDGYFRIVPQSITQTNFTLEGSARSSVIQSTSATADHFTIEATGANITGLTFVSTQVRTAGAYVKVALAGERFDCSSLVAFGAFTLLQIEGDPLDPAIQGGVYTATDLLAESTVTGGLPFLVNGGYLVTLDNLRQIGDGTVSAQNGPLAGLKVTRCADLSLGGNSQFLNCEYALYVIPPAGASVNSMRIDGGFFGTSYRGSFITGEDGGEIDRFMAIGSWFGENLDSGGGVAGIGPGLTVKGAAAGRLNQVTLTDCEFPLCQGDGLNVDQYARSVQVMGGWADGCLGSGYSFNGTQSFSLIGVRSGAENFGGNGFPYFIGAASDYFRVSLNDFSGNGGAGTNAAGTGATKIFTNNIA